jgi:hypothetical protein
VLTLPRCRTGPGLTWGLPERCIPPLQSRASVLLARTLLIRALCGVLALTFCLPPVATAAQAEDPTVLPGTYTFHSPDPFAAGDAMVNLHLTLGPDGSAHVEQVSASEEGDSFNADGSWTARGDTVRLVLDYANGQAIPEPETTPFSSWTVFRPSLRMRTEQHRSRSVRLQWLKVRSTTNVQGWVAADLLQAPARGSTSARRRIYLGHRRSGACPERSRRIDPSITGDHPAGHRALADRLHDPRGLVPRLRMTVLDP